MNLRRRRKLTEKGNATEHGIAGRKTAGGRIERKVDLYGGNGQEPADATLQNGWRGPLKSEGLQESLRNAFGDDPLNIGEPETYGAANLPSIPPAMGLRQPDTLKASRIRQPVESPPGDA